MKKLGLLISMLSFAGFAGANTTDDLLKPYFAVRAALAGDTVEGISDAAKTLAGRSKALQDSRKATADENEEAGRILEGAKALSGANLEKAREAFKAVSDAMMRLVQKAPGKGKAVVVFFCSMAPGYWLQENESIGNPYYGKAMLRCGKKVEGAQGKADSAGNAHGAGGKGGCC